MLILARTGWPSALREWEQVVFQAFQPEAIQERALVRSLVSRLASGTRGPHLGAPAHHSPIRLSQNPPDDYNGPRHVATMRPLLQRPDGEDWFDWEERPGPEPASNACGPDDGLPVHVRYVEKSRLESVRS